MRSDTNGELSILGDPMNLLDAALVAGCGVGLLRYSRAAAIILFVYFIIAKLYISIEIARPSGIGIAIVFLYFFWKGIQGSFAYHRLRREADPNYRPAPKWSYFLGIPIAILLFVAVGIGLLSEVGILPATAVIDGSELSHHDSALLISQGIVESDETVELFYSAGLTSIRDEGNLLTDKRIISYERAGGELIVYATPIENVADIKIVQKGDFINVTIIEVWTFDGDGFRLFLSAEGNGDELFINKITKRIGQTHNQALQPTPTSGAAER